VIESPVIVVAEDDPQVASLIRFRLERIGCVVHVGDDGEKALNLINEIKPNLVVLDVMMPVMDGFEVLRSIQSSPDTRGIPAIMLTAREAEDDVLKGFELGAVDYMSKPFSPAELAARVNAALNGRHG